MGFKFERILLYIMIKWKKVKCKERKDQSTASGINGLVDMIWVIKILLLHDL